MPVDYAQKRIKELEQICTTRATPLLLADLASCYFTVGRTEDALPLVECAYEKVKRPDICLNLSLVYRDLGRYDDAFRLMEEAYELDANDEYIRLGYAEGLLKAGFWDRAWPIYDNARPTQQFAAFDLKLPREVKEWHGQPPPENHRLLVINEGGTGDRFSYARWLPELTKRGINWIFFPYDELYSFYERLFSKEQLVRNGQQIDPDPTHWVTTFALPAKLNARPTNIPEPLPITATPEAIEKYKINRSDNLPVVGLCYEAAELHQGGLKIRSLTEGQAMRLVCMTGDLVHWVSLQKDKKIPYPVGNVHLSSWEDTAGLLHNLDAVVTVDTGVMHLSGAMRKPMATLLSANSCWKFLRTGEKCIWYPTSKIFRSTTKGFEPAVDMLIAAIRNGTAWNTNTNKKAVHAI